MNLDKRRILDFMESPDKNRWIQYGPMQAYVRKGYHNIDRQVVRTFDIANVSIEREELRGKGIFRSFVQDVEALYRSHRTWFEDMTGIYIENVFTSRFQEGLLRMGFELLGSDVSVPCFFSPWPIVWREFIRGN